MREKVNELQIQDWLSCVHLNLPVPETRVTSSHTPFPLIRKLWLRLLLQDSSAIVHSFPVVEVVSLRCVVSEVQVVDGSKACSTECMGIRLESHRRSLSARHLSIRRNKNIKSTYHFANKPKILI